MTDLVKRYQFRDRNESVGYGLTVSQAYAVEALARRGALTMGELAEDLHLSVSAMTRVVQPLVESKVLQRERSPRDRRVTYVELSKKGEKMWERIEDDLVSVDEEILARIAPRDRDTLIRVLRALSGSIDRWRNEQEEETK